MRLGFAYAPSPSLNATDSQPRMDTVSAPYGRRLLLRGQGPIQPSAAAAPGPMSRKVNNWHPKTTFALVGRQPPRASDQMRDQDLGCCKQRPSRLPMPACATFLFPPSWPPDCSGHRAFLGARVRLKSPAEA